MVYRIFRQSCILILFFLTVQLAASALAQESGDTGNAEEEKPSYMWSERALVIAGTTTDIDEAHKIAQRTAKNLGIPYNSRGLVPHANHGLTLSREDCEKEEWEYPCYMPRNRFSDEISVSIEYSSQYTGLAEGYYIVIIASGEADSPILAEVLTNAQQILPDAYLARTTVYMGCMH